MHCTGWGRRFSQCEYFDLYGQSHSFEALGASWEVLPPTSGNETSGTVKDESKRHTLKQSEMPDMQIWAGQLLLTSDEPGTGSELFGFRPFTWFTIGSWSSDFTLGGPGTRNREPLNKNPDDLASTLWTIYKLAFTNTRLFLSHALSTSIHSPLSSLLNTEYFG